MTDKADAPRAAGDDGAPPRDATLATCLLSEPAVAAGTISAAGLHFISVHQYTAAEYTYLDNLLNPWWTALTERLPLWLAPNAVTVWGFAHCAVAYAALAWHSPDFDVVPPGRTLVLAGYCGAAYFTLDCMDGKQARRTGSGSPLGQLL